MTASPADESTATKLAIDRTRLAYERTLMAWVRTAASMISFGFTVYKAMQFLADQSKTAEVPHVITPREFGMALIALGIVSLVLATIEHRRHIQALRDQYGPIEPSVAAIVAFILSILGIVGLVSVYLRY
jgi:putative membrane protein